jgi:hypothetical protein
MGTYREAQGHHDDESVISGENTLTVQKFKRNIQQN